MIEWQVADVLFRTLAAFTACLGFLLTLIEIVKILIEIVKKFIESAIERAVEKVFNKNNEEVRSRKRKRRP